MHYGGTPHGATYAPVAEINQPGWSGARDVDLPRRPVL